MISASLFLNSSASLNLSSSFDPSFRINLDWFLISTAKSSSESRTQLERSPSKFLRFELHGVASRDSLGVALAKPDNIIIVISGDGNQLMSLGTLATIGRMSTKSLIEVVPDNECNETTGRQETSSSSVKFHGSALSSGFKSSEYVDSLDKLGTILSKSLRSERSIFAHAKIDKEKTSPPRAQIDPLRTKRNS